MAMECCTKGDYAAAGALIESAIEQAPNHPVAHYLIGMLACHGGAVDTGVRYLERAVGLEVGNRQFLAALADARLLQQREEEALALYAEAFPAESEAINGLNDSTSPWKLAHPDWTSTLRRVVLPLPGPGTGQFQAGRSMRFDDAAPYHLLNWSLVLISRRQGHRAKWLLEHAVAANTGLGYAHAALGILCTLNREWTTALTEARAARAVETESFAGANDLCILAAQLGLGTPVEDLDPLFDWSAFSVSSPTIQSAIGSLPEIEGDAASHFPPDALVCFIACDSRYLTEHAIALACSIRENSEHCAIRLHIFSPDQEAWTVVRRLKDAIEPVPLSVTWESVEFERYGGRSVYCPYVRFGRLHQLLRSTPNRIVMLDADSLVRGDLELALRNCRAIGLVHTAGEPMWHQYLAGFSVFRRSAEAERFLSLLAAFLVSNVLAGRGGVYLDQIGLYVCARHRRDAFGDAIQELPIERFCDTLFQGSALVWSVTQNKSADSLFARYRQAMLTRYENTRDFR